MKKILIIDTIHNAFEEALKNDFEFTDGTQLSKQQVLQVIGDYEGVVIRSRFRLDEEFFSLAVKLRFIARAGSGMENIDLKAAHQRGVHCISAPEANRDGVGEHSMALLLALLNRIRIADNEVRKGVWKREENRGTELQGKTVGIIGFGNMGSAFAQRLSGFDVTILAYDKYITIDRKAFPHVKQVALEELFEHADIISMHIPLNEETTYLVDEPFISRFTKDIYFINTARGKVVKTAAIVAALKSGKIRGACLDVIEYETSSFETLDKDQLPGEWQYLINSDKVILTPHIAGWSYESHRKLSEVMARKVMQLYHIK